MILTAATVAACSKPEPAPAPVRAVRTMTVGVASATGVREYAAEIRARTESRLSFRVGGKVVQRHVSLGDTVKVGQALAQLDPQDLKLGQEAAAAALQAARINEQQARSDFARYKELRDQGFISGSELERRETALKAAQAQLEQAQAQAGVQGNQASYATLVANANGVITSIDAEVGAVVSAGTPVLQLAHEGPRDAVFSVPEDRVAAVRALLGRAGALKVRLWSGGEAAPATVREVAAAADPVTRTFVVRADMGRSDVRLGQTATVLIDQPRTVAVLKSVPLTAVLERGGRPNVWVLDPATMKVRLQPIEIAGAEGNQVLVSGGLQDGESVITAGVHVLNEGQVVKKYIEPTVSALGSVSAR